jgi:hypothetical protein
MCASKAYLKLIQSWLEAQSCGAVSTVHADGGRVLCHIMGPGQMPSGSIHLRGGSDLPKPFIYKTASTASTASTAEADTIKNVVRPQRSNSHPILVMIF